MQYQKKTTVKTFFLYGFFFCYVQQIFAYNLLFLVFFYANNLKLCKQLKYFLQINHSLINICKSSSYLIFSVYVQYTKVRINCLFLILVLLSVSISYGHPQRLDWQGRPTRRTTTTTTTVAPTTASSETFARCLRNCPSTTQYNPVCGSNGVTYDNNGKLQCAVRCGLRGTTSYTKRKQLREEICFTLFTFLFLSLLTFSSLVLDLTSSFGGSC